MKHRSKRRWGLGIIVIFILFISGVQPAWGMHEIGPEELVLPISYSDILLHPDEMSEDLDFIIQTLKEVHPFFEHEENRQFFDELASIAKEKVKEPMSRQDFYLIANQLVNFLDSETHLWFPKEDRYLPLKLRWVSDGILVTEVLDSQLPISAGDELLMLGGYRPDDLLAELRNLLPNENDYRIFALGGSHLTAGFILDALGVISKSGKVEMTLKKPTGEIYTFPVPWKMIDSEREPSPLLEPERDPWYEWYVREDKNYGLFRFDLCKETKDFQKELALFFDAVESSEVQNVVFDLRHNTGGDIEVVDSLLEYCPAQVVQYPTVDIRYSEQVRTAIGYSRADHLLTSLLHLIWNGDKAILRPRDRSTIFEGRFFVLTSNKTFGAASLLAAILSDNDLATIVGEPTGNPPSSYGDGLTFYTPNLDFYLTVSYKKSTRPDVRKDLVNALMPDFLVPTTIQDLRIGRDPQLEWIENYCTQLKR